jgi:hypothetical protein
MKRSYYIREVTFRPAESEGQPGDAPHPLSNNGPAPSHNIKAPEKDERNNRNTKNVQQPALRNLLIVFIFYTGKAAGNPRTNCKKP